MGWVDKGRKSGAKLEVVEVVGPSVEPINVLEWNDGWCYNLGHCKRRSLSDYSLLVLDHPLGFLIIVLRIWPCLCFVILRRIVEREVS